MFGNSGFGQTYFGQGILQVIVKPLRLFTAALSLLWQNTRSL